MRRVLAATLLLAACDPPPEPVPVGPDAWEPFRSPTMTTDIDLAVEGDVATARWSVGFWSNVDDGLLQCVQEIVLTGTVSYEPVDGCADCTGLLAFDPSGAFDASDPRQDPAHCDPRYLQESGWNLGVSPSVSRAGGGQGDFLELAWISAADHEASGLLFAEGLDAAILNTVADSEGEVYAGGLFVRAVPGSLSGAIGLADAATAPEAGSDWRIWARLNHAVDGGDEGPPLTGDFIGRGFWIINFSLPEEEEAR